MRLSRDGVAVDYRLEVSQETAALELVDRKGVDDLDKFYQAYLRQQEPAVAFNLNAKLDGKPLDFAVGDQSSYDKAANVYTFHFQAPWRLEPGSPHHFTFREANYDLDDFSVLRLTLTADDTVTLANVVAPDETLMARPGGDRKPGDGERLRKVSADVRVAEAGDAAAPAPAAPTDKPAETAAGPRTLLDLLLNNGQGLVVLLLLAAAFGAIHALTPGHGKAMVAAYLVGERGTVGHAVLLGVVVTITHTIAVLLIAGLLLFLPDKAAPSVGRLLGLVGGLLVAGLGFFLFYRRLTGGHDHFHFGGGHHHHHGQDHDHVHDHHHHDHDHDHEHVHGTTAVASAPARVETVRWWRLVVLGISGGIVPCWDAIAMLGLAISANRLWLGLPLLLAFSAGLAGVLVVIGIGVVHARNFAGKRFGATERLRPLFQALPLVSAAFLMVIGVWLCYGAMHG